MSTCKRTHRMCWGRACSRLTLALTSMASASRRRRTHPSCPNTEAIIKAVPPNCGQMQHTRRHRVPQSTRGAWASTRGCGARHATRTRVPSSAGRRVAAQPARPRAVERAVGTRRRLGRARRRKQQRRRGRGRPREAHAAAHPIRIVPVDVPSTLDQPPELRLVAVLCGLPQFLVLLGLGGTEPPHVFCAVSAAREGRPTSSLTRNRSEIVRPPSPQRCEACHAPRGHFDSRANSMLDEGCLPAGLPSWP